MTHTPGEWKVSALKNSGEDDNVYIETAGELVICEVGGFVIGQEAAYANAHLIAAAPALLEACEAMVRAYPYSDIVDGGLCTCATCKAYRIGKAAIELTKKEGE